jgi:hypothetical protein
MITIFVLLVIFITAVASGITVVTVIAAAAVVINTQNWIYTIHVCLLGNQT